jgi:phosphonate transport system substrate-binding protein
MKRGKIPNNLGGAKPKTSASKDTAFWIKTVSFVVVCLLAIAALWVFIRPLLPISSTKLPDKITIGVLMINKEKEQPNYDELANYLSKQSNTQFVVDAIEIAKETALKDAQEKITKKEWDIAFTTEPFTSIAAINEGYFFVARMSQVAPLLQTAIIVKNDSAIKSLENISTNTKLAMGDANSAALYYMPIYDLYGKGFKRMPQKSPALLNSIKALNEGQVDAAAVLYGNSFQTRDELKPLTELSKKINQGEYRVISLSRPIVSGSVYISPKLNNDKNFLEKLLLEVPADIRSKAKYEVGQREEDYGFFKGLQRRVDTILDCADGNPRTTNVYDLAPKSCAEDVEGTISGIRQRGSSKVELFVKSISTEYGILLSQTDLIEKLSKTFGSQNQGSLESLYSNLDKIKIKISKVSPSKEPRGGMTYFDFTDGSDESTKSRLQLEKINKSA